MVFDPQISMTHPNFPPSDLASVALNREFQLISLEPLPASSRGEEEEVNEIVADEAE